MRLNLTINKTNGLRMKKAYLASGCFWCTETIFDNVDGVTKVIPGYMGGTKKNPTYEEVCTGLTGHAELVEITYDSNMVSFKKLLEIFSVSYTHLRAHETLMNLVCRLLLEKKKI